jgi:cytochrome c oxidase assembly protein subunit 15
LLLGGLAWLSWSLWRGASTASQRRWGAALAGLGAWQVASGLGNVLLGWPLAAALAHTAGAAALAVVLTLVLARSRPAFRSAAWQRPVTVSSPMAS